MGAKALRVALEQAYSLIFHKPLGRVASLFSHRVEVAYVEIPDANEIIGEFTRQCVARDIFNFELL